MSDTATLISELATAPGVIIPLIHEVPPRILKLRPSPAKWSAYEHAIHLSQSDVAFRARLDLILSTPEPVIETIENSAEDEAGAMLDIDLDESLDRYIGERATLVTQLRKLSEEEWQKTAVHEALEIVVDTSITAKRLVRVLDLLKSQHGVPKAIRVDNDRPGIRCSPHYSLVTLAINL